MAIISIRDRILQNAQETLMKMIDDGDSELVIANQVNVVEKLRARMKPLEPSSELPLARDYVGNPLKCL